MDLADFIVDSGGTPQPNWTVVLKAASNNIPNAGSVIDTTTTDVNGRWEFTGLAAGDYDVIATSPAGAEKVLWKGLAAVPQSFGDGHVASAAGIALTKLDEGTADSTVNPATAPTDLDGRISQVVATLLRHGAGANWYDDPLLRTNALVNPSFEIWQRGTSFSADGYTADRWQLSKGGTTAVTVARDSSTVEAGGGTYSCQAVVSSFDSVSFLAQRLENPLNWRGRIVTFSMRVKTNVANAVRLQVDSDTENVISAYHSGGGGWETLSCTLTLTTPTRVDAFVRFEANATINLDMGCFSVGKAAHYAPVHPADDLARCQRYYEVLADASHLWVGHGQCVSTTQARVLRPLAVEKGGTPTVNIVSPTNFDLRTNTNASAAVTALTAGITNSPSMVELIATAGGGGLTAGDATQLILGSTGSISVEWNP